MKTVASLFLTLVLIMSSFVLNVQEGQAETSEPLLSLTYRQVFQGKEATLGNLMYAKQIARHVGDDLTGLMEQNLLSFGENNAYRPIKIFQNTKSPCFFLQYAFEGSYTGEGNNYILETPDTTMAEIDWDDLSWAFPRQSGCFFQDDSLAYSKAFNTPFLGDNNGDNDMYIRLNPAEESFEIIGNQSENERYQVFDAMTAREGLTIYGNFTLPAEDAGSPWPLVVFAHGFAGNNAIQRDVAILLAQHGIASYRFDFIGGTPYGCLSDGSFFDMSMLTEKQDLFAVVDFVKTQEFVDKNNIFLFGESMGGAVAAMVAAEIPEAIKGQIHYYPAFSISEQTRAVYKSEADIPERAGTSAGIMVAKKFYADALTIEIFKEIAPYTGPVLIFHGSADAVVPLYYAKKASEILENAELFVYENEGHGFTRETKYQTISKMIAFIKYWVHSAEETDGMKP